MDLQRDTIPAASADASARSRVLHWLRQPYDRLMRFLIPRFLVGTQDLLDGAVTNSKIAADAVTADKIMDGSIGTLELADGAVTYPKLGDGAVITQKLADSSIIDTKIASAAVTTAKLAPQAVDTAAIADGAVTTPKLAVNGVQEFNLAANSVSARTISDGNVTTAKLAYARALIYTSVPIPVQSGVSYALPYNSVVYDFGGVSNLSSYPTRLTVPPGMNWARVMANIMWQNVFSGDVGVFINKNGNSFFGMPYLQFSATQSTLPPHMNISSSWVQVVPGDYFEVFVSQTSGSSQNIGTGVNTTFAIECMG